MFLKKSCLFCSTVFFFLFLNSADISAEEPVCINLFLIDGGRNMSDTPIVVEAINDYIEPILGFKVNIQHLPELNYGRTIAQNFLSGEDFDILYCDTIENALLYQSEGWLLPLDDLVQSYTPAFSSLFSEEYLSRLRIDGTLFFLPCYHDQAGCWGIEYNKKIAETCGLDMSKIQSYRDLTEVFQTVKEKCPHIFPVAETVLPLWDPLDDELGVLMDFSAPVISDLYSSDLFEAMVYQNYAWNEAGYILDTVSYPASDIDYLSSGLVFSSITAGKPDTVSQESRITGIPIGYVPLTPAFSTTENISRGFFALNGDTRHPDLAMQFLNMMYSDQTLANLITYGVEGIHYEFKDENRTFIGFPEGVDCTNSQYAKLLSWQSASQALTYPWEGDSPDIWDQLKIFNETAIVSTALGFRFNPDPVTDQFEACTDIQMLYRDGLLKGQLNPDYFLPRFQMELRNAGIDDVIAEKQTQLDAYLSQQKYKE